MVVVGFILEGGAVSCASLGMRRRVWEDYAGVVSSLDNLPNGWPLYSRIWGLVLRK